MAIIFLFAQLELRLLACQLLFRHRELLACFSDPRLVTLKTFIFSIEFFDSRHQLLFDRTGAFSKGLHLLVKFGRLGCLHFQLRML